MATTLALFLVVAATGNPRPAAAQDAYPSRPVRIILSLPAGSAPDIRTRIVAAQLTAQWGRQVVVESHAGAGGALSVQALLSAPADGYTLDRFIGVHGPSGATRQQPAIRRQPRPGLDRTD